jgi:MFS family permease
MRAVRWWPDHGLWRHPEFLRLWAAQAVSTIGSRITRTALPVLAVSVLAATPAGLALMMTVLYGPGLVLAVFAGGHVDRGEKRRLLVAADLVRAVAVATIPIAAWAGVLGLAHVIVVAGVVGAASALFTITDAAYLPAIVAPDLLGDGNAKLGATDSFAEIVGPALGGVLIRLFGAPLAVLIDAASYVWSAAFLVRLPRSRGTEASSSSGDLAAGVRALGAAPLVRRLVVAGMVDALAAGFFLALYMVFTLRDLDLGAATVGVVIGFGGVGALIGAVIAPHVRGDVRSLFVVMLVSRLASFLIPLAGSVTTAPAIALLIGHQLVGDGAMVVFTIHAVTLRQTALPGDVQGRAGAAIHVLTIGALLVGTILAGVIGSVIDAGTGLWVAAVVGMAAPAVLIRG